MNPVNKCIYLFVLDGSISVPVQTVHKKEAIGVWDTDTIHIHIEQEARFVVIELPINH